MMAMPNILKATRDLIREKHKFGNDKCRISFDTVPTAQGARYFIGIDELSINNLKTAKDNFDEFVYGIQVGAWIDAGDYPDDFMGRLLEDDGTYSNDIFMLGDLEKIVVGVVTSQELRQNINDLLAREERPSCYEDIKLPFAYVGRNRSEIVTSIPEIGVTDGKWVRRLMEFRGANQIVSRG